MDEWFEPYKIKVVEKIPLTTREERLAALGAAGWNTFLLRSADVTFDLLTDSGTNAMSDRQWAALMIGDEAYAGSRNFYRLEETVRRFYGYRHVVPTHQGRGAEHIVSELLIRPGEVVPGNMYFTTTRLHQELAGGTFVDVIVDEAHDPSNRSPFKGNVDLEKLEKVLTNEHVPYVSVAATVNMAGGQPISLENLRQVRELADRYRTKVILDATRAVENAYFVKEREPGQADRSIEEILLETCSYSDGCTMSGKKDSLVNIGGWLCLNDDDLAAHCRRHHRGHGEGAVTGDRSGAPGSGRAIHVEQPGAQTARRRKSLAQCHRPHGGAGEPGGSARGVQPRRDARGDANPRRFPRGGVRAHRAAG